MLSKETTLTFSAEKWVTFAILVTGQAAIVPDLTRPGCAGGLAWADQYSNRIEKARREGRDPADAA
jgi:hypothetical protein